MSGLCFLVVCPDRKDQVGQLHTIVVLGQPANHLHAIAFCYRLRGNVVVPNDGENFFGAQNRKCVIPASQGGFCGIALVPGGALEEISHLQHLAAVPVLPGQTTLADDLAGFPQQDSPKAKPILCVPLELLIQPLLHFLVGKGVFIGVHG